MSIWQWSALAIHALAGPLTAGHALLYKRDSRAAFGWIALCLLLPLGGPLIYYLLGINRVRARARALKGSPRRGRALKSQPGGGEAPPPPTDRRAEMARISAAVTGKPLCDGNAVAPLRDGDAAFPHMLEAIGAARHTVYLMTYLFDTGATGREFCAALGVAAARGVKVRVLIDGLGALYSWPRAARLLREAGVRVERFLPFRIWPPAAHVNLRNHRKMLLVDGGLGYVGGMNISGRHVVATAGRRRATRDLQFALHGPVVAELYAAFAETWRFATGEPLPPVRPARPAGAAACRVILDGPDENLNRLELTIAGMIAAARTSVRIMTPYFLPSRDLISALQSAVLRGAEVTILLPERSNLRYVDWACRNLLWELLEYGVRVCYQPPPFAHTKLLLIDDGYALVGSANIDPRSLRLNFELGVEIYAAEFAAEAGAYFEKMARAARDCSLAEVDGRSLAVRLRDSICWLFSPYL